MFPLGSVPLSAMASMGSRDPRGLLKLAQDNPDIVRGVAEQVARNPKMATALASKMVGQPKVPKIPKAPKVDMGYLMRQEKRMPMIRSKALQVATKGGVPPMLSRFL